MNQQREGTVKFLLLPLFQSLSKLFHQMLCSTKWLVLRSGDEQIFTTVLYRILAANVLHESLKIKLKNLTPGPNTRQLCRAGINKIKDMIRKVGWVPQKGILYVIPTPEHAEQCVNSFLDYDFSKVVSKVSA